jgi:hypothetical protein
MPEITRVGRRLIPDSENYGVEVRAESGLADKSLDDFGCPSSHYSPMNYRGGILPSRAAVKRKKRSAWATRLRRDLAPGLDVSVQI